MCSCATAQWTVTLKRLHGWCPSWRLHRIASGASYKRGMSVQEGQSPQSCARLYRTATYGFCSLPPTSWRMPGVTTWCTRLWRREQCPVGLFLLLWTCLAPSILKNWSFSATLTSAVTWTEDTRASATRCTSVSELRSCVLTDIKSDQRAECKIHTLCEWLCRICFSTLLIFIHSLYSRAHVVIIHPSFWYGNSPYGLWFPQITFILLRYYY